MLRWQHVTLALVFHGLAWETWLRPQAQRNGCLAPPGRQVKGGPLLRCSCRMLWVRLCCSEQLWSTRVSSPVHTL